ncbi:hypothetical protein RUM44_004770 [Polyplax serrata]|uniref:Uncharacterized protein n=1 Tax=Polyplax serrata TaxID=468196 RepID=A0ABR1B3S6_POLSC
MIKLDDFLSKKKEPAQVLDLSKVKITSKDDFKRYFDKIPECKVKPEKISADSMKVKEKDFTFLPGKKEEKNLREWSYPDPTPPDMKGVKLEDLCPINIDWKMLTTIRPKSKVEEDLFSRVVQLGKLDLKYQQMLKREKPTDWIRRTKNPKSSIIEMRVISCKECGEDFCDGSVCSKLTYENFFRPQPTTTNVNQNLLLAESSGQKTKKRKKKKRRRKKKQLDEGKCRRKKLGKTSIFNRPASTGCTRDHSRGRTLEAAANKFHHRALSSTRSFSCERRPVHRFIPKRSKSAPRIHFGGDTLESEFKRHEYISDSCLSNTEYSSQSDSESPDQKFFSPRLRLSGRRKLLSARVSFADRQERRESVESSSLKFIRQCTLYKEYYEDGTYRKYYRGSRSSESSSPTRSKSRSRSISQSPEKCSVKVTPLSTVQIQFDETSGPQFPERIVLPVGVPSMLTGRMKRKCTLKKKQGCLGKSDENLRGKDTEPTELVKTRRDLSRKGKSRLSPKAATISPETCLKTKGLFGKKLE